MNDNISYIYSIPYLLFYLILIILFFKANERIINFRSYTDLKWITLLALFLFIGLRGHIYSDWYSYYPKFESLPTMWDTAWWNSVFDKEMEPGFILYTIIIKSFFPNYFIWVALNTLLDLIILHLFLKKHTKFYILGFIAFFIMNGLFIEFNLFRNVKAILLFILSLDYLRKRQFIPYLVLNLIGLSFHYSALLFIPAYFLLNKPIPKYIVWLIFIASNIVFLFQIKWITYVIGDFVTLLNIQMISDKMTMYSGVEQALTFSLGYFERIISFLVFTLFYEKLVEQNSANKLFYNIYLLYFIFVFNFSEIISFSERFSILFVFSYWILYPNIYELLNSKIQKYAFLILFFSFGFIRVYSSNVNLLAKYDNLLWGIESYEERKIEFEQYSE